MRIAESYSFNVALGPSLDTFRISGAIILADGRYPFDMIRSRSIDPATVTAELTAYDTLAQGWQTFLLDYLTDLAPTYGSNGGQILASWGYCAGIYNWVLEVQLQLATGELVPILIRTADYNNWPTVEAVHSQVEAKIGTFPAAAPAPYVPPRPADETDVLGAESDTDLMVVALAEHFTGALPTGYSSLCGPVELNTDPVYRAMNRNVSPNVYLDWDTRV